VPKNKLGKEGGPGGGELEKKGGYIAEKRRRTQRNTMVGTPFFKGGGSKKTSDTRSHGKVEPVSCEHWGKGQGKKLKI